MGDFDPSVTDDLDPSAPSADDELEAADLDAARLRANYGQEPAGDQDKEILPESEADAAPPTMPITISKAQAYLAACRNSSPRVKYGLGSKAPFLHAVPGRDFTKIDCSGFVREAIRESTAPMVRFPDGSVVQHDWVRARRFRRTTIEAAKASDGKVRIAFLSPSDSPSGIGHVVLIHNGRTLESHGGVGPNSRDWTGRGWQASSKVYDLT
jgi:hypothetical protein